MEMVTTSLKVDMKDGIYMEVPKVLETVNQQTNVCKLVEALYRRKQTRERSTKGQHPIIIALYNDCLLAGKIMNIVESISLNLMK